jgi:tetratricopeptide (TPR) repeat protein
MWPRRASSLAWLGAGCLWSSVAFGQTANEQTAELLFREARQLLRENDYSPACEKLEQSQRLDPAAGTLILLAYCHEKMGRFASAHREYTEAAELADRSNNSEKSEAARRFAEKARGKQHVLVVVLENPGKNVEVRVDEEALRHTGKQAEIALDPGAHTVFVREAGNDWQKGIRIPTTPGRTIVNVPKLESGARVEPTSSSSWWSDNALGLTALGAGAIGIGVGSFFGLRAFSKNDESKEHCEPDEQHCREEGRDLRDEARTSATISNVGFAVGVIGLATGTVMILSNGSSTPARTGFGVNVGPRSAAGVFGGRF